MSPNRRFSIWIASLLVIGLGALAVLYIPLRKAERPAASEEESPWPEAAELDVFLQVREAMMPAYEAYGETLESAIDPGTPRHKVSIMKVVVGSRQMIDVMMAALGTRGMSVVRFRELTDLVYLRWWRVEGPGPVPEVELVAHIERYLEHRKTLFQELQPSDGNQEIERQREEDLAAKRRQLEEMRPIAAADPELRLGAMPGGAGALLEAHRERIAAADMGLFDSNYIVQVRRAGAGPRAPAASTEE